MASDNLEENTLVQEGDKPQYKHISFGTVSRPGFDEEEEEEEIVEIGAVRAQDSEPEDEDFDDDFDDDDEIDDEDYDEEVYQRELQARLAESAALSSESPEQAHSQQAPQSQDEDLPDYGLDDLEPLGLTQKIVIGCVAVLLIVMAVYIVKYWLGA